MLGEDFTILHSSCQELVTQLEILLHHSLLESFPILVHSLKSSQLIEELFLLLLLNHDVVHRGHLLVSNLLQVLLHKLTRRDFISIVDLLTKSEELLIW